MTRGVKVHIWATKNPQKTYHMWHYTVGTRDTVYFTDNCRNPRKIFEAAESDAKVLDRIIGAGYLKFLPSWSDLVTRGRH